MPAAATPSNISAAGEKTKCVDGLSGELSANQREGQSENGPISEQEVSRQIWSGLVGEEGGGINSSYIKSFVIIIMIIKK